MKILTTNFEIGIRSVAEHKSSNYGLSLFLVTTFENKTKQ